MSADQRAEDLVSRMTIEEKIAQMSHLAPAIDRLGVMAYEAMDEFPLMEGKYLFENDVKTYFAYDLEADYENSRPICLDGGYCKDGNLEVKLNVTNTGGFAGDEVVQLYIKDLASKFEQPKMKLRKFRRIHIAQGSTQEITMVLTKDDFSFWNPKIKKWSVEKGEFEILVGSSSENIKSKKTVFVRP